MNINRKVMGTAVASVLVVGAMVPGMASAKKAYKLTMVQSNSTLTGGGVDLKATVNGKPFGKCKVKGKVTVPIVIVKWTCKGGTMVLTTKDASIKGAFFVSTATFGKGTGKFKGIKGKLAAKGGVDGSDTNMKGKVTY